MIIAFLYIIIVVRPDLCFHRLQPPFLLSSDFLANYLKSPGGFSQWLASLFLQTFHSRIFGSLVLFTLAFGVWVITVKLLKRVYPGPSNALLSLFPFTLSIVLLNNYNFPLSVIISLIIVLLLVWLLSAAGKSIVSKMLFSAVGAVLVFFIAGSGFLLFYSILALFFTVKREEMMSFLFFPWLIGLAFLLPYQAGQAHFWFYPEKPFFMAYEPSGLYYLLLISLPAFFLLVSIFLLFQKRRDFPFINKRPVVAVASVCVALAGMALFSHRSAYNPDAKKIVLSDYSCYHHDAATTAKAATSMENYSFAANVNYNMAMARSGRLTDDFFSFFQISGCDALHPDVEFSPEMLFIAADFYYDLGYISEARHNAYEALVFYPHSPRALQLLVKVHLVCGEYKAAERCLNILEKGLVSRKVLEEFRPLLNDTSLISTNVELMEKRSFIPAQGELSPYIDQRFRDLLEANPNNRLAYECLLLYHLLDGQLEPFLDLYQENGNYFSESVDVYEEAILMYGMMNPFDTIHTFQVSQATENRFAEFGSLVEQYEGQGNMARNVLYHKMGQSYFYYLGFLYPRIVKTEYVKEEYDEAPI